MTFYPLTGILMLIVCLECLAILVWWSITTKGTWLRNAAARSIGALLLLMSLITAVATMSNLFGFFPGRAYVYVVLYVLLVISLAILGITMGVTQVRGNRKIREKQHAERT